MENIQALDRVAFAIGPIHVYWYGIIIGMGILLGYILANKEANKLGLKKELFADLLLWAIPTSIISARIYYVIFKLDYYVDHPLQMFAIWEGGIAIHGALIGAVATTIIFAKKNKVSFWKIADIAAPSLILGQAIGRWGNFMNQEAHGTEVTRSFLEGLFLPDFIINQMYIEGVYYHPTFLYESLWSLSGFILLFILRKFNPKQGELFFTYVIWYSIGRFFVEGMRTDSLMLTETLRIAQVISLALIVVAIFFIWMRRLNGYAKKRYSEVENS